MNAKKIMGAVLVALLAAALFVGAGAAADYKIGGTVFVNQALDAYFAELTWTDEKGAIVTPLYDPADETKIYFPTAGVYNTIDQGVEVTLTVVSPSAIISGVAGTGANAYTFIPGTYYLGSAEPEVSVLPGTTGIMQGIITEDDFGIFLTLPNGQDVANPDFEDALDEKAAVGEYFVTVVYNADIFVNGTDVDQMSTKPVSFMVAEAGAVSITASVDQALKGDSFVITITGQPGVKYDVTYGLGDFEDVNLDQKSFYNIAGTDKGELTATDKEAGFWFVMPNTGKIDIVIESTSDVEESEKITVKQNSDNKKKASVTVKFNKGTISAKTDAASYFVGDVVKVIGESTDGEIVNMSIKGTNFFAKIMVDADGIGSIISEGPKYGATSPKTFEFKLDTSEITNEKDGFDGKKMDVGTYTLTIETANAKTTVPVVLKQPFISIISAPEVIVQKTEAEFVINAEADPRGVVYYIFGTNYFKTGAQDVADDDTTNQFTIELTEDDTKAMAAGQYFAVFQHPMYDQKFNILAFNVNSNYEFFLNTSADADEDSQYLFGFNGRQTANAAQALCDALDTQNIDDMYVKYSFFVVGEDESFVINEIPEEVAQGTTLAISGVDTANAGKTVQVEMISTAFAAVPKETVGSAAFIVATAEIAEDGTWEVTLDTSDLNVDEYSLSVAIDGLTKKNVNINVVEAADKPDTPVTPPADDEPGQDEPVAPETPGFGALAALAGLGAVAVLLLRRE